MLIVDRVRKSFEGKVILDNITFSINKGERIILKGPNGCGKTTLLKIIAGIIKPDSGRVEILKGTKIAFVFQEPIFLPWLTMKENLFLFSKDKDLIKDLVEYFKLQRFLNLLPEELSGGYQQIFSFIRAFTVHPDLLLLDEPFKSLDKEMKKKAKEFLLSYINSKKITLLMVSHQEEKEDLEIGNKILTLGSFSPLKDVSMLEVL